tara:strand:+ start:225 stop:662 length:438 start_codon:yes stop_codon:yes gene_type:complete
MNTNEQISKPNINNLKTSILLKKYPLTLLFLIGIINLPIQKAQSEEIIVKCTGRYEVNRGELIRPDWEKTYFKINLDDLKSYIDDNGIKKEGRTLIRQNSYTISNRDTNNRIITKYKIHRTHGTYVVDYLKRNRTLIGTCQKGRG